MTEIENGNITNRLPTKEALIQQYNVSRNTIRNTISYLNKAGITYTIQGSGAYIRPPRKENSIPINETNGFTRSLPNQVITTKIIDFNLVEANEEIMALLKCQSNDLVYRVERLRLKNNIPFAHEEAYYHKSVIHYLNQEIVMDSIFNYITKDLNLTIGFSDKYITCQKSEKNIADHLLLNENDPCIVIKDNVYLNNGILFNASKITYHYQHCEFYCSNQ